MLFEISVILSCLIFQCSGEATSCPECPRNSMPCHQLFGFDQPCSCTGCLTRCPIRGSICPTGEVCVTEDVHFGDVYVGQTAACVPFQQCPQIQCPVGCPESGYFVDINGCTTCLCVDPCQELKCPDNRCSASSVNPGTEPNYSCY